MACDDQKGRLGKLQGITQTGKRQELTTLEFGIAILHFVDDEQLVLVLEQGIYDSGAVVGSIRQVAK